MKRGFYLVWLDGMRPVLLDGMPTPMLISLGRAEAWMRTAGIWRARDDKYDPPDTEYVKVVITRNYEDYPE